MNLVKRVWRIISVISIILVVVFGVRMYLNYRQTQKNEIQLYNQWRNEMTGVQRDLNSSGPGETPKGMSMNPNMALIDAEGLSDTAAELAGEAGSLFKGRVSNVFTEMAMSSRSINEELGMMKDIGKYVGGTFEFTQPKTSIADRNFASTQLTALLEGMPVRATTVSQILNQEQHLKPLNDGNQKAFGIYSAKFVQFMESTGQMTRAK